MTEKRDTPDKHLTFSQRYGYDPLPEPMRLEELSDDLRRKIWNAALAFLTMDEPILIRNVLGEFLKLPHDEIDANVPFDERHANYRETKDKILSGAFNRVLDFIEIVVNFNRLTGGPFTEKAGSPEFTGHQNKFILAIGVLFDTSVPYRLDISQNPCQFFPRSSKEQGEATQLAIKTIHECGMEGAATHLRQAAHHINAKEYADSVESSIEAVESVARRIAPKSKTLGDALKNLEKKGLLTNSQLKTGFEKIYAYTNSEEGVRHSLVFKDSADVGLDEAVFMFGACASFAAYLVNKHHQMKQQ